MLVKASNIKLVERVTYLLIIRLYLKFGSNLRIPTQLFDIEKVNPIESTNKIYLLNINMSISNIYFTSKN